ncbi:MAG TPA: hypothetical protein VIY48_13765 [Candidatus Paceibacterota bacterium]
MPLKNGYSQKTVQENIAQLIREGVPRNNAIRAALDHSRGVFFKRFPRGALPSYLVPKDGRRMKNPAGCMPCGSMKPRRNPVPPSSRAGFVSRETQLQNARDLYERFTGHEGNEVVSIDKPHMPDVMLVVGDVDGILYTTTRDGETEKYIHKFKKNCRPLFCVSHDGKQIFMLGGSYDFTERGIVDRSDS